VLQAASVCLLHQAQARLCAAHMLAISRSCTNLEQTWAAARPCMQEGSKWYGILQSIASTLSQTCVKNVSGHSLCPQHNAQFPPSHSVLSMWGYDADSLYAMYTGFMSVIALQGPGASSAADVSQRHPAVPGSSQQLQGKSSVQQPGECLSLHCEQ